MNNFKLFFFENREYISKNKSQILNLINQTIKDYKFEKKYDIEKNLTHKFENDIKLSKIMKELLKKYELIDFIDFHINNKGRCSKQIKNPMWKVKKNNKTFYVMYCEKNKLVELCEKSINIIKKFQEKNNNNLRLTFHSTGNGYISSTDTYQKKRLYIHQIIMNCYGNGRGTKTISVDHIDRNPLNNQYENLRIATRKEQENNSKGIMTGTKRARNKNAKKLPDGLTQEMLPKYVVYYHECYDKKNNKYREFLKIESTHPKLDKPWTTTKSNKKTIFEKLTDVKQKLYELENDIKNENQKLLPQYHSLKIYKGIPYLIYDRKTTEKRYNLRMKLKENYNIKEELEKFTEKLHNKYPELK